jgi:hypothetical protein
MDLLPLSSPAGGGERADETEEVAAVSALPLAGDDTAGNAVAAGQAGDKTALI